ncbi:hypothetical protein [Asticcacaulis sp. W401b]|uniref:hypothetical protein n=1 Tax=Asticcacaulis sp. W401b TaxID=3388666 RepID=UPI0039710729
MTTPLGQAIENLYEAFETPRPKHIDGCPCCSDRKKVRNDHKPLRELAADDLGAYTVSLFLTVGSVVDFKYFLSRIFEISTTDEDWWPSVEIVLDKLRLGEWLKWPQFEKQAIQTFLDSWFQERLDDTTAEIDEFNLDQRLDDLLCGFSKAGIVLKPYLNRLSTYEKALKTVWHVNAGTLESHNRLSNAFWEADSKDANEVMAFLRSPEVQAIVKA